MGARAAGMAYASSCLYDEWALFNNIGGLASVKKSKVAFTYNVHPTFRSFNSVAALVVVPVNFGVAGLGVYHFGDDLYNEQLINLGFSNRLGIASLGLKVNYIQYHAQGFGTKGVATISFGGIAELTKQLSVGFHITNINQPEISVSDSRETLPTILITGISLRPSEKVIVTTELEKTIAEAVSWKNGLEYQFNKKFSARSGFSIHPDVAFFGIGFCPKKISLAYALAYNFATGLRHQATLGYNLTSK